MIGTTIAGRYRIVAGLGRGGMASVWRAVDEHLRRQVALKVLCSGEGDPARHRRFEREFRIVAALEHPGIVRMYDAGWFRDGSGWYTMEVLEGASVEDLLEQGGPFSSERARDLLRQAADALTAVHDAGVVHRDLKPANLMVTSAGRLVVVDFGLAGGMDMTALTASDMMVGTPLYMTPEHLGQGSVDERSDIFQLGAVGYTMLAGRPPFPGDTLAAIAPQILRGHPEPLRSRRPELPGWWETVLGRCLDPEPARRFPSARELVAALDSSPHDEASDPAPPCADPPSPLRGVASVARSALAPSPARRLRLWKPAVLVGLPVLVLALALGLRSTVPRDTTVKNLRAQAAPGGLTVSWESDTPYDSVLEVEPAGARPWSVASAGSPTSVHRVDVGGLDEGREVAVRVVHPDGRRSLGVRAVAGAFTVVPRSFGPGGEGEELVLVVPPALRLRLVWPGGEAEGVFLDEAGTLVRVPLPPSTPTRGAAVIEVRPRDGEPRRLGLAAVMTEAASDLVRRMGRFRWESFRAAVAGDLRRSLLDAAAAVDPLRSGAAFDVAAALRRERDLRLGDSVSARVEATGFLQTLDAASRLGALLSDRALVPWPIRRRLYDGWMDALRLAVLSHRYDLQHRNLGRPLPPLGDLALTDRPDPSFSTIVPLHGPPREPLRLGFIVGAGSGRGAVARWSGSADIPPGPPPRRAELRIVTKAFADYLIRARVGSLDGLVLADRPIFDSHGKQPVVLCQRIPPDVLGADTVAVELWLEWPFDDVDADVIDIREVTLALDR